MANEKSDYEKAHATYRALAKAAAGGDPKAREDKSKAMGEIIAIERDAARAGTILSATYRGDRIDVQTETCSSKKSLQEEYVRRFDGEKKVNVGGKEQTLQEYHSRRLVGR